MNILYKLERVEHSGSRGERGEERTDGRYPDRKGSVYRLDSLYLGYPMVLEYVWDNQGTDKSGYLYTTPVVSVEFGKENNGELIVETMNTVYYLKEHRLVNVWN